jgi:hypothetical protein
VLARAAASEQAAARLAAWLGPSRRARERLAA